MNRQLINVACVAGALTFVVVILAEFVTYAPPPPAGQRAALAGTPIERAVQVILWNHEDQRVDHRTWQQAARFLLTAGDPFERLTNLDARLGDEPQKSIAATGYTSYYTAFALLTEGKEDEAKACWEFGLASFERWSDTPRPLLDGNDTLYHARTLMRLGRDAESYEILGMLVQEAQGGSGTENLLVPLARTLAEIDQVELASSLLLDAFARRSPRERERFADTLIRGGRAWAASDEPTAAGMAENAAATALIELLEGERGSRSSVLEKSRANGRALRALGFEDRAKDVWAAAENAALLAATGDPGPDGWIDPYTWRWVAKFRALLGDTDGAAEAIRRIEPGFLSPNELAEDTDLGQYMDQPEMRAAVLVHGRPDDWPEPDSPGSD